MAELLVEGGSLHHGDEPCTRLAIDEIALTIGTAPDNTLITREAQVSEHHATIVRGDSVDDLTLVDLGSSSGTILNGRRVARARLQHGDRIQVGDLRLRFLDDPDSPFLQLELDSAEDLRHQPLPSGGDVAGSESELLSSLVQASEILGEYRDPTVQRERLLDLLFAALEVDCAVIAIRDPDSGLLRPAARRQRWRSRAREDILRISGTIVHRVLERGEPLIVLDAHQELGTATPRILRIGSALCAPLRIAGRTVGLVYADSRERRVQYGLAEQHGFLALAGYIAATLQHPPQHGELLAAAPVSIGARSPAPQARETGGFIHASEVMCEVVRRARSYASPTPGPLPVLLVGERGCGKQHLARLMHELSPRREEPFSVIDCPTLPHAVAEERLWGPHVTGGTVYLTEVGQLPAPVQTRLARILRAQQDGGRTPETPDLRVLAGTSQDLDELVALWQLRADLRDLLAVLTIEVPPLRERPEEIPLLVNHFAAMYAPPDRPGQPVGITREAMDLLQRWPWPGNVRELRNCVLRMLVDSGKPILDVPDLPEPQGDGSAAMPPDPAPQSFPTLAQVEIEHIARVLDRLSWNRTLSAQVLGIGRDTLARKIAAAGLRETPRAAGDPPPLPEEGLASLRTVLAEHVGRVLAHTGWRREPAAGILGICRDTLRRRIREYDLEPTQDA